MLLASLMALASLHSFHASPPKPLLIAHNANRDRSPFCFDQDAFHWSFGLSGHADRRQEQADDDLGGVARGRAPGWSALLQQRNGIDLGRPG